MAEVTDTPIKQGHGPFLIQNLGPDDLYLGGEDVDENNGLVIKSDEAVSVGFSNNYFFVVSGGTSNIRVLHNGTAIFSKTPPPEA